MWDFWLPFGLGLVGTCFKEGERAFLYERRAGPTTTPDFYLPLPDSSSHEVLMAIPADHPDFAQ
jgi:hypothetical protein